MIHYAIMALGESDPAVIAAIREEVHCLGATELHTPEQVDSARPDQGVCLVFVNTHDACAADLARPALARALQHDRVPEKVISVFAGQELAATARARSYFGDYFPTAPQIGLLSDGEVVYMCDRDDMLKRLKSVDSIVAEIVGVFDEHGRDFDGD